MKQVDESVNKTLILKDILSEMLGKDWITPDHIFALAELSGHWSMGASVAAVLNSVGVLYSHTDDRTGKSNFLSLAILWLESLDHQDIPF